MPLVRQNICIYWGTNSSIITIFWSLRILCAYIYFRQMPQYMWLCVWREIVWACAHVCEFAGSRCTRMSVYMWICAHMCPCMPCCALSSSPPPDLDLLLHVVVDEPFGVDEVVRRVKGHRVERPADISLVHLTAACLGENQPLYGGHKATLRGRLAISILRVHSTKSGPQPDRKTDQGGLHVFISIYTWSLLHTIITYLTILTSCRY